MSGRVAFPLWLACLLAACACAAVAAELRLFGAPASYDVETTVLLNDVARKDKEVGYKIKATLDVTPVWSNPNRHTHHLLEFRLHSPQLYLRGKHVRADFLPYESVWARHADSTFYAQWRDGLVAEAYLDPDEPLDVLNYKKSLVSLFQFQAVEGEHNETDISGPCLVLYQSISTNVFRKIKRQCRYEANGVVVSARRAAHYTLHEAGGGGSGLRGVYAEELLVLGHATLGLQARAWQRLEARSSAPAPRAAPAAAAAEPPAPPAALRPLPLSMDDAHSTQELDEDEDEEVVAAALQWAGAGAEQAGGGGTAAAARAALRALPALRAATPQHLAALLASADQHDLAGLCRLLGLAGTRAAHSAARDALQLHAREPSPRLAHHYLAAFALADAPDEWAVLEVLRLGEEGRDEAAAESALLAAAAAAPRAGPRAAQLVRDALARALARCKDERCRASRARALGNLRREDAAEPLLALAERCARDEPRAALAAVQALAAAPPAALGFARLDRLGELALDERASLELRAAALDLVTQRRAELPAPLARLAHQLHERGPHELRRVLWQRLAALAPRHAQAARLPRMLEPHLRGWDARAHAGTSSVLVRETGCGAAGWRAVLDSMQLARGGLLRRSAVRLLAEDADATDSTVELLAVEVWTRGLEAFGGGSPGVEPEDAGGGLELTVGGARMREIPLFDGQAELLGHVWAGTGSAATPVLRALRPLGGARGAAPLLAGARLAGEWRAALSLALDAQAQASLWWRTARAALELRAGAAGEARAALRTAWGRVAARADSSAEPRLHITADLDFYDDVRLCVRVDTADHEHGRNVSLESEQGARRLRVRRWRATRLARPGRSLALGRPNDDTCRTLRSADADADAV